MHVDHINIAAPADLLEEVRAWYGKILGLENGFRPEFQSDGYWLYAHGKPIVHLSEHDGYLEDDKQGYLDHVAFQTSGLDVMEERLNSLGIEYRSNHIPEIPMTQLFTRDPAGTGVEINFPNEP